jgi:hypothetical protein
MWYTSPAIGTLKVYRASQKTKANAAVAASATLIVKTDAAGKVAGAVITTNDYVLVHDGSGSYQLRGINTVGTVSSETVELTLASAITCSALERVYIVRAADIATLATAAETQKDLRYVFNTFPGFPASVLLEATGTCRMSVSYDTEALS